MVLPLAIGDRCSRRSEYNVNLIHGTSLVLVIGLGVIELEMGGPSVFRHLLLLSLLLLVSLSLVFCSPGSFNLPVA